MKILVINPGSTSTKLAVYEDEQPVWTKSVHHPVEETASFQRAVIANSRKCCLLLSSHKIGVDSFIKVCDANIFDYIVTDWNCSEEHLAAFESEGIYLTVVEEPK